MECPLDNLAVPSQRCVRGVLVSLFRPLSTYAENSYNSENEIGQAKNGFSRFSPAPEVERSRYLPCHVNKVISVNEGPLCGHYESPVAVEAFGQTIGYRLYPSGPPTCRRKAYPKGSSSASFLTWPCACLQRLVGPVLAQHHEQVATVAW